MTESSYQTVPSGDTLLWPHESHVNTLLNTVETEAYWHGPPPSESPENSRDVPTLPRRSMRSPANLNISVAE